MMQFLNLVILPILFAVSPALALDENYRKAIRVADPSQLGYYVSIAEECNLELGNVERVVEKELISLRINPIKNSNYGEKSLILEITMRCVALPEAVSAPAGALVYIVSASFNFVSSGVMYQIVNTRQHLGIQVKSGLFDAVELMVGEAATDYVQSNM